MHVDVWSKTESDRWHSQCKAPEAEVGLHRIFASMDMVVAGQENVITERYRSTRRLASYREYDGEQLEGFTERHTQSYLCVKKITLPID